MSRIAYIGRFSRIDDEEYIAEGFENLGHEVLRLEESLDTDELIRRVDEFNPDLVIWAKLKIDKPSKFVWHCRKYKTACWVFDLYIGYQREHFLEHPAFKADYVFTTDGGHDKEWKERGLNHHCVRQGIRTKECFMLESSNPSGVAFVGTYNPYLLTRVHMTDSVKNYIRDFTWYGKDDAHEIRGTKLNELYAKTKVIIGDSVYSPYYWSNRVVETLGRGGFLIQQDVEGLKAEYPHLITFERGNYEELKQLITYYLRNDKSREELRKKNFEWVKNNYTIEKKCAELLRIAFN